MPQDVLTQKEKALFAQNIKAPAESAAARPFETWSENHTIDEIQLAMAEINDYIAGQEKQLDEQIAYSRDTARQKQDMVKQHAAAQLEFVSYHPEFSATDGVSGNILAARIKALMVAGGLDPESTPYTLEMLEQGFRELVNEQRIDWNPKKGNPWGRVVYKRNSEPGYAPEPLTQEEIEAKLEDGTMTLEEVREGADQYLASQNPNAPANTDPVQEPESSPDAPVTRQLGIAALALGRHIHIQQ